MSLSCAIDDDYDFCIDISDDMETSTEPQACIECKKVIAPGEKYYDVREFRTGDEDDIDENGESLEDEEVTVAILPCCEACGDLAISVLALGYCWSYGQLRNDIAEHMDSNGSL